MTDGLLTTKRVEFLASQWSEFVRIIPIVTAREEASQFVRPLQLTRNCLPEEQLQTSVTEGYFALFGRDRARRHWRHRSSARACIGLLRIDPAVGARHFHRHVSKENAQGGAVCRGVVIERDKKRAGFPVVSPIRYQELGPFLRARSAAVVDNLLDPVVSTDV